MLNPIYSSSFKSRATGSSLLIPRQCEIRAGSAWFLCPEISQTLHEALISATSHTDSTAGNTGGSAVSIPAWGGDDSSKGTTASYANLQGCIKQDLRKYSEP